MPGNEPAGVAAGRSATGGVRLRSVRVQPRATGWRRSYRRHRTADPRPAHVPRGPLRRARWPPLAGPSALPASHADQSCWKPRAADSPPRTIRHGSTMQRAFIYFAAVIGMATVFVATLHRRRPRAGPATRTPVRRNPLCRRIGAAAGAPARSRSPPSTWVSSRPGDVAEPGTYAVNFVNDGGTFHDVTFADGTSSAPRGTRPPRARSPSADGMTFICSVPGHSDAGHDGRGDGRDGRRRLGEPEPSHGDHERTAEEMRDIDAEVTGQFPAETEGRGNVRSSSPRSRTTARCSGS